jgi:hypothetical protein
MVAPWKRGAIDGFWPADIYSARCAGREFLALRGARPSCLNRPQVLYDL